MKIPHYISIEKGMDLYPLIHAYSSPIPLKKEELKPQKRKKKIIINTHFNPSRIRMTIIWSQKTLDTI